MTSWVTGDVSDLRRCALCDDIPTVQSFHSPQTTSSTHGPCGEIRPWECEAASANPSLGVARGADVIFGFFYISSQAVTVCSADLAVSGKLRAFFLKNYSFKCGAEWWTCALTRDLNISLRSISEDVAGSCYRPICHRARGESRAALMT